MERKELIYLENIFSKFQKRGFTNFLDQAENLLFCSYLRGKKISYSVYMAYPGAEKVIVYSEKLPKVCCLEIKSKNVLTHRSILGSLFHLQIDSSLFGDIILWENHYYFFCLSEMLTYFLTSFRQVGKFQIQVVEQDLNLLANYQRQYELKKIIVPSQRLDTVLAHLLNLSRGKIEELLKEKQVLLNYQVVLKGKELRESDIFSVRKYGKYRYLGIEKTTKNGKNILLIEKYL